MNILTKSFAVAACIAIAGIPIVAHANDVQAGKLTIEAPWARASAGMARAGAAFMQIENASGEADKLLSASADVSKVVELHTHIHDNGVMRMRKVDAIDIPAQGAAVLKPGGLHVMFIGLHAPLVKGDVIPVTLHFANSGDVDIQVEVRGVGSR